MTTLTNHWRPLRHWARLSLYDRERLSKLCAELHEVEQTIRDLS